MSNFMKKIFKKKPNVSQIIQSKMNGILDDLKTHKKYNCRFEVNIDVDKLKLLLDILEKVDYKLYTELQENIRSEFTFSK